MQIFLAIAIVTFVGPLTGLAEQPSRSGPTSLEDANLLDQNRAELKKPENPMTYLTLIAEKIGPVKYEMSNALSKLKASEFMNKIAKTNKKTFNQEINLSASFGGVTAESKTSIGLEASTNRESSDSKKLEEKISTGLKSTYTVPAGQYYLQMAEMKLYVVNINGKPNYIQMPTGIIKKGIYTYKWLQMFNKDNTFEYVYPMKKLTMYKVEDFVKAMPENLIKTVTVSMGLPDVNKFYYIESARWNNISLQAWTQGNNGKDVGCLPVSQIDSWMKGTQGIQTDWFKQWKFVPVPYKKGLYYIINRQFNNALYRGFNWGSWGAQKIPTHGRKDEYQWKVKANSKYGGTVTIESAVKEEPMSTWSKVLGKNLVTYNCGPQSNFGVVKSVSGKWGKFCWADVNGPNGLFRSSHSVANRFFTNPYERRFAKLLLDLRVDSPTCVSSNNWNMRNKMNEFAKATLNNPTADDKLWKLKDVSAAVATTTTTPSTTTIAAQVQVPEYIEVSSNGGAATAQSSSMGIYKLQEEYRNNFPVWKKRGKDQYLFVASDNLWSIESNPADSTGTYIYNNKNNPTPVSPSTLTDGWWYYGDKQWKTDNTIRIVAVTG